MDSRVEWRHCPVMLGGKNLLQGQAAFYPIADGGAAKASLPTPRRDSLCLAVKCNVVVSPARMGSQRILYRPTALKSPVQYSNRESGFPRPRREVLCFAIKCYPALGGMSNGLSQCLLNGPAPVNTVSDYKAADASYSLPLHERFGYAVESNAVIRSRIVCLLALTRPAAVIGRIVAIVINAIQRVFGGRVAHVLIERDKAVAPFIADGDATPTIISKRVIAWVKTAVLHVQPSTIDSRIAFSMSLSHSHLLSLLYRIGDLMSSFNTWVVHRRLIRNGARCL